MIRELRSTNDIVMEILKESEKARNSDNYLICLVLTKIAKKKGIDIEKMSLPQCLLHMKEYGLPSFETIRRTRQKIQATHPELAGSDDVEALRVVREEEFRSYARERLV